MEDGHGGWGWRMDMEDGDGGSSQWSAGRLQILFIITYNHDNQRVASQSFRNEICVAATTGQER